MATTKITYPIDFKELPWPTRAQLCIGHIVRQLEGGMIEYRSFDTHQLGTEGPQLVQMYMRGKVLTEDLKAPFEEVNKTLPEAREWAIQSLSKLRWLVVNWENTELVPTNLRDELEKIVTRDLLAGKILMEPTGYRGLKYSDWLFVRPDETARVNEEKFRSYESSSTREMAVLQIMDDVIRSPKTYTRPYFRADGSDGEKTALRNLLRKDFIEILSESPGEITAIINHFYWRTMNWDVDRPRDLESVADRGWVASWAVWQRAKFQLLEG